MKKFLIFLFASCSLTLLSFPLYAADDFAPKILSAPPENILSFTKTEINKACNLPFLNMSQDEQHKVLTFGKDGDYIDCKVLTFHQIGKIDADEYWGATYQLIPPTSDDPALQMNENTATASAVFVMRPSFSEKYIYLIGMGINIPSPSDTFDDPTLVTSPDGPILLLPSSGGNSDMNNSLYYHWHDMAWHLLDTTSWYNELDKKTPKHLGTFIWNGDWPELDTLTDENALWRAGDDHANPTGGSFKAQLSIVDDRFVLKSVTFDNNTDGKDDLIP
jgi:hypothetical protein